MHCCECNCLYFLAFVKLTCFYAYRWLSRIPKGYCGIIYFIQEYFFKNSFGIIFQEQARSDVWATASVNHDWVSSAKSSLLKSYIVRR